MEDLGWMIEEYKVSLFAQELKTPFPISRKRLDARMEDILRMLCFFSAPSRTGKRSGISVR